MSDLLALDVAILPPPDVGDRAVALSAGLPASDFQGLRLDEGHLPHVTLTQQFVHADELDRALVQVDDLLRAQSSLTLRVAGAGKARTSTVWLGIERTEALALLHARLMEALQDFERFGGSAAAFVDGDARAADVEWVSEYRVKSSFRSYMPHITLGHSSDPPRIEPFTFEATTVAICHLGRFCTCRRVLRMWELAAA